jgi:hypothetical protein
LRARFGAELFWRRDVRVDLAPGRWVRSPDRSTRFDAVADAVEDFVAGLDPGGQVLAGSDEETMARFCYVLAPGRLPPILAGGRHHR